MWILSCSLEIFGINSLCRLFTWIMRHLTWLNSFICLSFKQNWFYELIRNKNASLILDWQKEIPSILTTYLRLEGWRLLDQKTSPLPSFLLLSQYLIPSGSVAQCQGAGFVCRRPGLKSYCDDHFLDLVTLSQIHLSL